LKVYNLNEIADSKLLYGRKPPRFMFYIILITLALITGFLVWSVKSVKTYMVKGQGIVTTEGKSNLRAKILGINKTFSNPLFSNTIVNFNNFIL